MKPLFLLLGVFALSATVAVITAGDWYLSFCGNLAMCAMLCFTALGHVLFTKGMVLMIPPFIPGRVALVYITGVLEVLLGVALLLPDTRLMAGYALIAFFVAILPANIYAATKSIDLEKGTYNGPGLSYLWFRVPLQLFFIGWVYFFAIK
ncbi:hypothetical protein ACDQ55_16115 [Chitinophaga sp. 30R24]|uniref:DoxX family protein n=1 Tax=Chitinophaga sp. 30R24 TaxID=3248838 RepID=UPI003B90950B